jgi:hypothetical protein
MKTVDPKSKQQDSIMAEVRNIKQQRAGKFDYNVTAMARDLQSQEKGDPRFINLNRSIGASPEACCLDR